jgi:hypothetical protein
LKENVNFELQNKEIKTKCYQSPNKTVKSCQVSLKYDPAKKQEFLGPGPKSCFVAIGTGRTLRVKLGYTILTNYITSTLDQQCCLVASEGERAIHDLAHVPWNAKATRRTYKISLGLKAKDAQNLKPP